MKELDELVQAYPDLEFLLQGCESVPPIYENTYHKDPIAYTEQAASVAQRESNANVVGILVVQHSIIVVERTGNHPGLALPSGTVKKRESLLNACAREAMEETDVEIVPESMRTQGIEIRTFLNVATQERQHVIVGTVVGKVDTGQTPRLTQAAMDEGIVSVGTHPTNAMPPLIFNDTARVREAFPDLAA